MVGALLMTGARAADSVRWSTIYGARPRSRDPLPEPARARSRSNGVPRA